MTEYEIMFIVKTTMEDDQIKKTAEEIKDLISGEKSKVVEFKDLGRKKLAYPINKELNGNYYVMTVEATKKVIKEFDRKTRLNENVIRHLIIKKEGE